MILKSKIILVLVVFSFFFQGTAISAPADNFTGQINADNINLRVDATTSAQVICTLAQSDLVEVVGEAYGWYKIRLPKQAPAYIRKDLVECIKNDLAAESATCRSAKVIKDKINIRSKPDESSWILGTADNQTVINILAAQGNWYKVQPVFQSYGWVNKKFVNREIVKIKPQEKTAVVLKEVQPLPELVLEGTVTPYGVILWRQATHKLLTAENKLYLLKGNRKSLNNLNYRKVKVIGKIINSSEAKYPIVEIDVIEVLN